jgi:hypothetical protein
MNRKIFKNFFYLILIFLIFNFLTNFVFADNERMKSDDFMSGVVMKDAWSPDWFDKYSEEGIVDLPNCGAKYVGFHIFWSYSSTDTPKMQSAYESEKFTDDSTRLNTQKDMLKLLKKRGYKVVLLPSLYFGYMLGKLDPTQETSLNNTLYDPHTATWYDNWFVDYEKFMQEMATLAEECDVDILACGWHLQYTAIDGKDGYDTTTKWRNLIDKMRTWYSGKIVFLAGTNGTSANDTANIKFWDKVDYVGLDLSGGIQNYAGTIDPTVAQAKAGFDSMLATLDVKNICETNNKKAILVTSYASSTVCFNGLWFEDFDPQPDYVVDEDKQNTAYQGFYESIKDKVYIQGLLAWGYWWKKTFYNNTSGDASFDKGCSIRNKKAEATIFGYVATTDTGVFIENNDVKSESLNNKKARFVISIPVNTFATNTILDYFITSTSGLNDTSNTDEKLELLDYSFKLQAQDNSSPSKNINISIYYNSADIVNPDEIFVAFYNTSTNKWELLTTTVDATNKKISAETQKTGIFALVKKIPVVMDRLFVYPNPCKTGLLNIEKLEKNTDIKIFDITGKQIKKFIYTGASGKTEWDLKSDKNEKVASGVYLVLAKTPSGKKYKEKVAILN